MKRLGDRFVGLIENTPLSDRLVLRLAFFAIIGAGIWLIISLNNSQTSLSAVRGGMITEGIVGTPRFANPALALTRADQDVTALVYSGLMKIGPDGTLMNDVAESIEVSDDGLIYTIKIRKDVKFHDNTPLTARDVIYTIGLFQDPDLKSPLRGNWTDVFVDELSEYEMTITLEEAYAPFIENFTFGIMPAHAWSSLPIEQLPFSQLNTEPVGSGPFKVLDAGRDTSGLISHYTLEAWRENGYNPNIDTLELSFYQNEEDLVLGLSEGVVDATAYVPGEQIQQFTKENYILYEVSLPRAFGIFFNQNRSSALRDESVRAALNVALDREQLIESVLYGYGVPIVGPTPLKDDAIESEDSTTATATGTPTERAIALLEDDGWSKNELDLWEKEIDEETVILSVTIKTSNAPLFEALVGAVADAWKAVGVEVVTEQYEQSALVQSVIRPRDFQTLLFGLDMSRSYDLYPFWHSSQQNDPGLNIAQYTNVSVDELLEAARTEQSEPTRISTLKEASAIISEEQPAIFLFQPTMTYLVSDEVTMTPAHSIGRMSERFTNIESWHTESDSLWSVFRDDL
tara:strand:- start:2075 stop:3793 length:1719 start_codon:yes stop_codon:yes gene_type:complete